MASDSALEPLPSPPGKPLVGNMLSIDADAPLQDLMRLARETGPVFSLNMMGTPLVVASGADIVDELCDEKRFDKAVRGSLRRIRAIGGDGLFTGDTQEPNWAKAHNILLPTFGQRAMVNYLPMMQDIASQLILKWERLNADDDIDVVHDMTALALDTIGVCGFGYRFNSFYRRDYHPFIDALTRTLETCMKQRGLPLEDILLRRELAQQKLDVAYMSGLVDDIIRERRRSGGAGHNDLLNSMLAGVDKATGEGLSDENIRYQINTFLIAGHETTSGLLSFTLYFLINHPDVLAKARDEVDRVFGTDLSATPTIREVNQLTYVQQILLESLRLWPTAPAFGLYPYKDEVVGGKYRLKARTFVTVLTLMLHRDKSIWGEDPEAFNPDHFSREAVEKRPANAYKPFGNGQRACIGRQFAMQEATLVLGLILQRFELHDHLNYTLKIKETLSVKPDGFRIKVSPRAGRVRSVLLPGQVKVQETAGVPAAPVHDRHGTPLMVLFGSNLGTTEDFAREIAHEGERSGFDVSLKPLDEATGDLPKTGALVIACASYNGAPPDNAGKFVTWLETAAANAAKGVSYCVLGCGNRDWASTFQATPRLIDERLQALGGKQMRPLGEADAREDLDGGFRAWFAPLFSEIGANLGLEGDFSGKSESAPLYTVELADDSAETEVQPGFASVSLLASRELQSGPRSTRHLEFQLADGMAYRPGDHLAIAPVNSVQLCERVEARFGFSPDTRLKLTTGSGRSGHLPTGASVSLRRLLEHRAELQAVATRHQLRILAQHTRCPKSRPELEALAAEGAKDIYKAEVAAKRKSVLDLLEQFPACELPFGLYLEMLPQLAPRYYSISSSPAANPRQCSVTVGVVSGPARSGKGDYAGACSTYLAALQPGDQVKAAVRETKAGFRLPDDPALPVIMVGPGTGIAPFRAFLQERAAQKAAGRTVGPALLFFGCRHPDQDFLYREELEAFAAAGLAEVFAAFSRHEGKKTYVQDLIREQRDRVIALARQGAKLYVCGDGSRMEPDVRRALTTLYAEEADTDMTAAEAWMEDMTAKNRYVLDVWAGN